MSLARRSVHLAEWIVYLAASMSIGIAWSVVYALVSGSFTGATSVDWLKVLEEFGPWALGASLMVGLLYRFFALWKNRLPSLWFATLIPGIGALFFLAMARGPMVLGYDDLGIALAATLVITYACGGIVLIPLSIVHTKALEWVHVKLTEWTPQASIRSIRHVGYATLCAGLIVATEMPRFFDRKAHEYAVLVGERFGLTMPQTAYALSSRDTVDSETYYPIQDAHFRVPGGMFWPPRAEAVDMTRGESAGDVRQRFQDITGQDMPFVSKLEQVKWYEPGGWVVASRLRTADADYVEFRRQ